MRLAVGDKLISNMHRLASMMLYLTYRCANSRDYGLINNGDLLDLSRFRESKVANALLKNDSKMSWLERKLNKISMKERVIDRYSKMANTQLYFVDYLEELTKFVGSHLKNKGIHTENVGYALCVEKNITNNLFMESRTDLSDFVKKNIASTMIVVDPGEKELHNMLQKSQLSPPSFYVHAHIQDSYVYLKLQQVVDTTSANGGITQQSTVFVKDKRIDFTQVQDQICERLWNHIHSLDEKEKEDFVDLCKSGSMEYKSFGEALTFFIGEKVIDLKS